MVKQLNLFNQPSLNVVKKTKELMAASAKASGFSREEILDRMNDLAGRFGVRLVKGNGSCLSMATFEKWLNPEAMEHVPPYNSIYIFCAAIDDMEVFRVTLAPLGVMLIDGDDVKMLLWAKEYHRAKDARTKMRKLELEL